MRRALACLMVFLWVWVLAQAAWQGMSGHFHKGSANAPGCALCTVTLGLLDVPATTAPACEPSLGPVLPEAPSSAEPVPVRACLPHGRAPPAAELP